MNQPVLCTLAAGGSHPLIDIDGTLLIQFGLFLIMAALATQWLFKPYLQMRKERHDSTTGAREAAEKDASQADARLAEYEGRLAVARSKAYDEQRKIRAQATAYQQEVTDKARAEANQVLDEARAHIREQAESARAELLPKADALAKELATKLLSREVA